MVCWQTALILAGGGHEVNAWEAPTEPSKWKREHVRGSWRRVAQLHVQCITCSHGKLRLNNVGVQTNVMCHMHELHCSGSWLCAASAVAAVNPPAVDDDALTMLSTSVMGGVAGCVCRTRRLGGGHLLSDPVLWWQEGSCTCTCVRQVIADRNRQQGTNTCLRGFTHKLCSPLSDARCPRHTPIPSVLTAPIVYLHPRKLQSQVALSPADADTWLHVVTVLTASFR
jgi:hypothetical protein